MTDGQVMKGRNNRYYSTYMMMRAAGGQDKDGWNRNAGCREEYRFPGICLSLFLLSLSLSFFRNNRFSNWCNEPELYTLHCTTRSLIRFCLRQELTKGRRRGGRGKERLSHKKREFCTQSPVGRSVGRVDHHRSETQHRQRRRRRRHRLSSLPLNLSVHK